MSKAVQLTSHSLFALTEGWRMTGSANRLEESRDGHRLSKKTFIPRGCQGDGLNIGPGPEAGG